MGTSYRGQVCKLSKYTSCSIQQQVLGTTGGEHRCSGPGRLGNGKQFCKCPVLSSTSRVRDSQESKGLRDDTCSFLASSKLVSDSKENGHRSTGLNTKLKMRGHRYTGTVPEPDVENSCLEGIWCKTLRVDNGWSAYAIRRLKYSLAPSTLASYDKMIGKFAKFCRETGMSFPPDNTAPIADFLCFIADSSDRPESVLRTASASIGHVYKGLELDNLVELSSVQMLIKGLVKSGTRVPMQRSRVMPVKRFHDLFLSWPENGKLTLKDLRLKAITLLSLCLMLRPSDAAPKGLLSNASGEQTMVFCTDQIEYTTAGATFTLFGIKNDTSRKGFQVSIPRGSVAKLDPVSTIQDYIVRTDEIRGRHGPVFISLRAPFSALTASSIARILDEAIVLAGLGGQGYSAKSFRPTGATCAVEGKIDPETVRKVGRWKNAEVFFSHYVHSKTPDDFTDIVINHE